MMDLDDKKRIRANFTILAKQIRSVDIEDYLYQEGILTNEDIEALSPRRVEPTRATRILLRMIQDKGKNAFKVFCDALEEDEKGALVHLLKNTDISKVDYTDLEHTPEEKLRTMQESILAQQNLIRMQTEELEMYKAKLREKEKDQAAQNSKDWNDKLDRMKRETADAITEESVVAFLQDRMLKQDTVDGPSRSASAQSLSLLDSYMPVFAQQWLGQGGATRSTEEISKVMGPDIVTFLIRKDSVPPAPNKYAAKMREFVTRIYSKHESEFQGMLKSLDISEMTGLQTFANIANEMFDEYNPNEKSIWGHLGTLYAFGAYVAQSMEMAQFIGDFLGFFVSRRLGPDIDKLGGWQNFLEYYQERFPRSLWRSLAERLFSLSLWVTDISSQPPEARMST